MTENINLDPNSDDTTGHKALDGQPSVHGGVQPEGSKVAKRAYDEDDTVGHKAWGAEPGFISGALSDKEETRS